MPLVDLSHHLRRPDQTNPPNRKDLTLMSAGNAPLPSVSLDEARRAHEPSMEEILASIRRIIADDDRLPPLRREPSESRREPEPAFSPQSAYARPALEPVAPAREVDARADEVAHHAEPDDSDDEDALSEPLVAHAFVEEPEEAEAVDAHWDGDELPPDAAEEADESVAPQLVSSDAAASIGAHFQALAASTIINDSGLLREYAKEMLRPMLKQWLDDNLPVMVEKLVRAEIERVARGRR